MRVCRAIWEARGGCFVYAGSPRQQPSRLAASRRERGNETWPPEAVSGSFLVASWRRYFAGGDDCDLRHPDTSEPVYIQPSIAGEDAPSVATRGRREDRRGRRAGSTGRSIRPSPECVPAIRLQQIRRGLPGGASNSARRKPQGACEIYHYNTDGTLDWGYFQINTVHLTRPGLNLRDLLDCRANIDFAYQLYLERGFQPWSTYNNGAYRKFLRRP
jgi:hypothetical protein